jgi:hypothetical protein
MLQDKIRSGSIMLKIGKMIKMLNLKKLKWEINNQEFL